MRCTGNDRIARQKYCTDHKDDESDEYQPIEKFVFMKQRHIPTSPKTSKKQNYRNKQNQHQHEFSLWRALRNKTTTLKYLDGSACIPKQMAQPIIDIRGWFQSRLSIRLAK